MAIAFLRASHVALANPSIVVPVIDASAMKNNSPRQIDLPFDFTYRSKVRDDTAVFVSQSAHELQIRLVVSQSATSTANQETNGPSVLNDDYVGVYLDPQGARGFQYGFFANRRGARYQTSSENSSYSPEWSADAKYLTTGYAVTMKIPFRLIRTGGSHAWSAQFVRFIAASNSVAVWSYSEAAASPTDPAFLGVLDGVDVTADRSTALTSKGSVSNRSRPRLQVYALGQSTPTSDGGSTSRIGADASLPVTPTSSLVAAFHPDYSNVEVDQQTISPSAYARQYDEVRPFFTQVGSFFNQSFGCLNCPETLYTPAIPTFSSGYAYEGTQGRLTFSGFSAVGSARHDDAATVNYMLDDTKKQVFAGLQTVASDVSGLRDTSTTLDVGYQSQRTHFFVYSNFGEERGPLVTNPGRGNYLESGLGYANSTSSYVGAYQRLGSQFDPVDGYVAQNDIAGYEFTAKKQLNFSPTSALKDVIVSTYDARYNNSVGIPAQSDEHSKVVIDFHDLLSIGAGSGIYRIRTFDNAYLPFNNNSVSLAYKRSTNTPITVEYTGGDYSLGFLSSYDAQATVPVVRRINASVEAGRSRYLTSATGESPDDQILERLSLNFQVNKHIEFDAGVRKIIGTNLPNSYQTAVVNSPANCAPDPYQPGCFVKATNVSAAFHILTDRNEFYLVYGDPNNLATVPSLILKFIIYIGSPKGT